MKGITTKIWLQKQPNVIMSNNDNIITVKQRKKKGNTNKDSAVMNCTNCNK